MSGARRRRRHGLWLFGLASTAVALVGALILATDGSAGAAVDPGQGSSFAQSLFVTPHEGSLATGAVLGEALAGHTNSFARSQSQGLDLGAIGLSLSAGQTCGKPPPFTPDQIPQPLQAETGQAGAAQGFKQDPTTQSSKSGNPPPSFGSTEFVKANDIPYGEATTSYAAIDSAVFGVAGMISRAWSGVVNGQRVAAATSDIKSLSLLNGAVTLEGLHWEVSYPSGGSGSPSGSFSIGKALISGTALPGNPDLSQIRDAINKVLATIGLQLVLPDIKLDQGVQSVGPLQLLAEPNDTRDNLIAAINNPTQSEQQFVLGGLEGGFKGEPQSVAQIHCQSVTPITVAHITIASIDGGGFFSAGFGGVNASSSNIPPNQYNLGFGLGNLTIPGSSIFTAGTPGTPGVAGTPGSVGQPALATAAPALASLGGQSSRATGVRAAATGSPAGGPLLAIGLGGLGLLALLAEADRRKMTRALRTATFEE